jgi:hypothetical protein
MTSEILAVQDSMLTDLTPEQRARYDALMDPHAGCESAPYCGCDPRCKVTSTNPGWWERAVAGECSHGGHGWDGETCSDAPSVTGPGY